MLAALDDPSKETIVLGDDIDLTEDILEINRSVTIQGNEYLLNAGVQILSSDVTVNELQATYIVINKGDIDSTVITNSTTTGNLATVGIGANNHNQDSMTITGNTVTGGAIGLYPSATSAEADFVISDNTVSGSVGESIWLAFMGDLADDKGFAEELAANNQLTPAEGSPRVKVYTAFADGNTTFVTVD